MLYILLNNTERPFIRFLAGKTLVVPNNMAGNALLPLDCRSSVNSSFVLGCRKEVRFSRKIW